MNKYRQKTMKSILPLMNRGEAGVITKIRGPVSLHRHLNGLGIRIGARIHLTDINYPDHDAKIRIIVGSQIVSLPGELAHGIQVAVTRVVEEERHETKMERTRLKYLFCQQG